MSDVDEYKPEPRKVEKRYEITFLDPDCIRRVAGNSVTLDGAMRYAIEGRVKYTGGYWQIYDRLKDRVHMPFITR